MIWGYPYFRKRPIWIQLDKSNMARKDPIGKNGLVMFDPIKDPNVAL
jgi:hypothetical protein